MKAGKRILAGILTSVMTITLLAGIPMGKNGEVSAARRTLKGPSTGSDGVVTWDCVYFGNYPQSDTTGETKDPIKWRVLSVEGNDALLLADQNLDVRKYNETGLIVTWETCTMRSWLNGYGSDSNASQINYSNDNFMQRAFTASERNAIKTSDLVGKDKVFLLSSYEVNDPAYGFCGGSFNEHDRARIRTNTAYAAAGGTIGSENVHMSWWLRTVFYTGNVMNVESSGEVNFSGAGAHLNDCGVCPALQLNLSSTDVWTYAGTVSSDGSSTGCPHQSTELKGKKEACTKAGYTGDTYCADCGAKIKGGEIIPAKGHQWDSGIITKQATEKEDAVKTFTCTVCGKIRTETVLGTARKNQASKDLIDVPKEVQAVTDASITKQSSEDVKGAVFNALQARTTKLTNKSITLKWKKFSRADGYKIYGNRCGKKNHYKLIKDVEKSKTAYTQKKLKKGTYYKYVVAAYKIVDGKKVTIAVSKTIHATTTGGKYGVAKSVKVNKSKITLKKGKKFTIKATEVKKDKKIKNHRKTAYESSNTKVATVSKKGVVKAKKKGTCYIYVYAQNGVYKRVKVTVK